MEVPRIVASSSRQGVKFIRTLTQMKAQMSERPWVDISVIDT